MAGKSTISITFKLDGDGKGFKDLANDAEGLKKIVSSTISEAQQLNTGAINFAAMATSIDAAQRSLSQLQACMKDLADAYAVQEVNEVRLATVMRQRMGATDAEIQSIKDLASAQQELGVIGDEVQLSGAQQIATFLTEKESLETLLPAMNNLLAQQKGLNATTQDAISVGNLMGKVMQGQTSALTRVGITFSEAEEHVLKYGTEQQRAAMLAQVITNNVGDMNAELAKTESGKQQQLANTLGDVKEQIGGLINGALPFITIAASSAQALAGIVTLTAGIRKGAVAIAAFNIKGKASAAVTLLMGVNAKKSAAVMRVFSTAMKTGTYSATALKLALRGLLMATGIGLAITAVTMAIEHFSSSADDAADSADGLSEAEERAARKADKAKQAYEEQAQAINQSRAVLEINIQRLKQFEGTREEEIKLVKEMNAAYGETMGYFSTVSSWYDALISNSEAYCRQMVLEAKTRTYANQIAEKEELIRAYRAGEQVPWEEAQTWLDEQGIDAVTGGGGTMEAYIRSVEWEIAQLQKNMQQAVSEVNSLSFKVKGSKTEPTLGSGSGTDTLVWKEKAETLKEITGNIQILQNKLQDASVEEAADINQQIDVWNAKAEAIRNAGKAVVSNTEVWNDQAETLKDIEVNISILQKKLQTATIEEAALINQQIDAWNAKAEAIRNAGKAADQTATTWKEQASTLQDIGDNIQILNNRLQTATIEEAALINQQIDAWNAKAEAIRNAGKAAEKTAKSTSEGLIESWGAIKGIGNSVQSITDALEGNGNAWQIVVSIVDGFISLYDGIKTIVGVIDLLTTASAAHATAKGVEAAAEGTEAATRATAATTNAAAATATIVANKLEAASWKELAAAEYMAAHAYIPFAGYGIAAGFTAAMLATVTAAGIPALAEGGVATGPTLALVGEYAGASGNPEVIAPLDKLRAMLPEPEGGPTDLQFKIKGDDLVAVYNRRINKVKRT